MKVVRALRVLTLVDDKVFTIFNRFKYMWTMRAAKLMCFGEPVIVRWWVKVKTYLTTNLGFFLTIIPGKVGFRSIAGRTCTFIRDIAFDSAESRFDGFAITLFVVRDKVIPFPVLFVWDDTWKFINLKFLVSRRFWIIISPLFKWDIFTDK